jgi:hypothetical protein
MIFINLCIPPTYCSIAGINLVSSFFVSIGIQRCIQATRDILMHTHAHYHLDFMGTIVWVYGLTTEMSFETNLTVLLDFMGTIA